LGCGGRRCELGGTATLRRGLGAGRVGALGTGGLDRRDLDDGGPSTELERGVLLFEVSSRRALGVKQCERRGVGEVAAVEAVPSRVWVKSSAWYSHDRCRLFAPLDPSILCGQGGTRYGIIAGSVNEWGASSSCRGGERRMGGVWGGWVGGGCGRCRQNGTSMHADETR